MRYIDINALLQVIRTVPDGAEECAVLLRAHRTLAVRFAHDRQGYIQRNGALKWRPLKVRITSILGKKCWYTEAEPTGGDLVIDHYRPKSIYWFLAFNESNYRVACPYANSSHHNDEHGCAGGKDENFPLRAPGNRARGRNQLNIERPVILDPCNEDDCKLIAFDLDGRPVMHPDFRSDAIALHRVENSKLLLNLDHPDFNTKREQLCKDIARDVKSHENSAHDPVHQQDIRESLAQKIAPTSPFSVAACHYLNAYRYFAWVQDILDAA